MSIEGYCCEGYQWLIIFIIVIVFFVASFQFRLLRTTQSNGNGFVLWPFQSTSLALDAITGLVNGSEFGAETQNIRI